jgi:tryptophan halogenase
VFLPVCWSLKDHLMIRSLLVVGGGSAGFLAAVTLKRRLARLPITVLRCQNSGLIDVEEGTTPNLGYHLHNYLGLDIKEFYHKVEPLWKLGIRFEWGPRPFFNYAFGFELDTQFQLLPHGTGFYLKDRQPFEATGIRTTLMNSDKVWPRQPNGWPVVLADEFGFHLQNDKLVGYLEGLAGQCGVTVLDGDITEVLQNEQGVTGVRLASGQTVEADFFVDASGLSSRLLGQALAEPFYSYEDSLFCDRALVGSWERTQEPIKTCTRAGTMTAGWSWQVEHERRLQAGYVYSSRFQSDAEAETEFRSAFPRVDATRLLSFRSGRREHFWVKNVAGVGDAALTVDPLEASALSTTCAHAQALANSLVDCELEPNRTMIFNYNRHLIRPADSLRDFLAVHYRFNSRIDSPFWRECQAKVQLHWAEKIVSFFKENGPSILGRRCLFMDTDLTDYGMEGYLAVLVGLCVPYSTSYTPSAQDLMNWSKIQQVARKKAAVGYTVAEALNLVRAPNWVWPQGFYKQAYLNRP